MRPKDQPDDRLLTLALDEESHDVLNDPFFHHQLGEVYRMAIHLDFVSLFIFTIVQNSKLSDICSIFIGEVIFF